MEDVTKMRDARLEQIQAQIARIQSQTEIIGQWRANWGMVGDLGRIENILNEAVTILSGYPPQIEGGIK